MMKNICPHYYRLKMNVELFNLEDGTGRIECSDLIDALIRANEMTEYEAYLYGNIIKYIFRCGRKGDKKEDLKKARNYLNELIG